jgi:hypothetical protein
LVVQSRKPRRKREVPILFFQVTVVRGGASAVPQFI